MVPRRLLRVLRQQRLSHPTTGGSWGGMAIEPLIAAEAGNKCPSGKSNTTTR